MWASRPAYAEPFTTVSVPTYPRPTFRDFRALRVLVRSYSDFQLLRTLKRLALCQPPQMLHGYARSSNRQWGSIEYRFLVAQDRRSKSDS